MASLNTKKISSINKMATVATVATVAKVVKKPIAVKEEVAECVICYEPLNNSSHKMIECEYTICRYKCCIACTRAYLLTSTNEPHCMECKQPWTPKFMLILTKKWMNEIYKPHREKFLCDIDISKIPETMEAAEQYKATLNEKSIRDDLRKKEHEILLKLSAIRNQINESITREHRLKRGEITKEEKKVFFMSCPSETCNGMLSTQYKCGICEKYTCHDCHEIIGNSKTPEIAHVCDANNLASAQAIKKETKQCPGCHNRIYRTEGCSQMWCTGCHTTFDWNTGKKVVSGPLHNPHLLEYMRTKNNGQVPRAPGDVQCGGICTRSEMNTITHKIGYDNLTCDNLRTIHRVVTDITLNRVRELREECQTLLDFQKQRIKYIVGEITKEELASRIFRNDRIRQKNTELLNIFELLSAVGIDMFNRLLANINLPREEVKKLVLEQIEQYNRLRLHCNGLFAIISNTYNQMVPQILEYGIESEKFNSRTMLKLSIDAENDGATAPDATAAPASATAPAPASATAAAPSALLSL